ncbi:MAG: VIT domain-containing protein [Planctomycetota bacterium]
MKPLIRVPILLASVALAATPAAQTSPAPWRPVRMTNLSATVRIADGVATTTLRGALRNEGSRPEEATWLLPLPPGAVADQFEMVAGGVRMSGEVLAADAARGVYEEIVRKRRDPGLLEFAGRGCLRARIFPVPPQGEVAVEVRWREILPETGGLHRWSLPARAAGLEGRPPERFVLDLAIESRVSLRNVYSPTGGVQVIRKDDHRAVASFEGDLHRLPPDELAVFYGLSEKEFGLNLLTYRRDGEAEGAFLMLISPRRDWDERQVLRKEITFVLDTSGSMQGKKIEQARGALRFFLESLRPEDRFNVIPFATEAMPFFPKPVPVTRETLDQALAMVREVNAIGGTNIHDALQRALTAPREATDLVPIVVFLTDGLPTVAETDPRRILAAARDWNARKTRIFVFGVGDDVNTVLLDTLAADAGGTRDYVRESEDIEEKTGTLFAKLSHPVMRDLELAVDGVRVTRQVPAVLPDLFVGSRLEVVGRYLGEGPRVIRLSGTVGDVRREFVYEGTFAAGRVAAHDFVPSLWAQRRVGMLLDQIRLHGENPELLDEVRRLGLEHGIVTPYTSHLILEEELQVSGGPPVRHEGGKQYGGPGNAVPPGERGGALGPGSPGPTTAGGGATAPAASDLDEIAARLAQAGVLPEGTSPEALRDLAGEVAREMRESGGALRGLGYADSGRKAVDDSVYLARLLAASDASDPASGADGWFLGRGSIARRGTPADLLSLFSRKVKDKVFHLRAGVWTDRALTAELAKAERILVEAYSTEYFDLLAKLPALGPYFALSTRLVVVLDGRVYEVRPPPPPEPEPAGAGEQNG